MGSEISAMGFCVWVLLFFSSFGVLSASSNSVGGTVSVDGKAAIAEIDDDFVCAALDWWPPEKCDYGSCSWGQASILNLDLSNNILFNAVKAFSPLKLRLGGTLQDKLVYGTQDLKQPCKPFAVKKTEMFEFSQGCLPMKRWDVLNAFFQKTGAKIFFGLNALTGKHIHRGGLAIGDWDYRNAESFIRYTVAKNYTIHGWELGNELCSGGVGTGITAAQYAADTIALHNLVQRVYGNVEPKPLVIAPGGFFDATWFKEFFDKTTTNLDVATRHIYNLGPGVDEHLVDKILNPSFLDGEANTFRNVQNVMRSSQTKAVQWIGEAGGSYNSGHDQVTNAFVFGFWYLDQLGMSATFGTKAYCRQSLIGGNYGLLNTTTFMPNPDYYNALLWHRLMGRKVLSTSFSGTSKVRAYAHCAKQSKGITLLLINFENSTTVQAKVEFRGTRTLQRSLLKHRHHHPGARFVKLPRFIASGNTREEYHLTPKDGNIHSQTILLNGTPLSVTSTGDIPPLVPAVVKSTAPITIAPLSFVFVHLPDAALPACN